MIETRSQHEKREKAESATRKSLADRYASKINGTVEQGPMTKPEAEVITARIVDGVENVGKLLLTAQRREAWKAMGYKSWREYATGEFKFSQSYAYRLMKHEEIAETISPMGEKPSERAMRSLAQLPLSRRRAAWKEAVTTAPNGKPTADHVAKVVRDRLPTPTVKLHGGVKNSRILWHLKFYWKQADIMQRSAFKSWIAVHP